LPHFMEHHSYDPPVDFKISVRNNSPWPTTVPGRKRKLPTECTQKEFVEPQRLKHMLEEFFSDEMDGEIILTNLGVELFGGSYKISCTAKTWNRGDKHKEWLISSDYLINYQQSKSAIVSMIQCWILWIYYFLTLLGILLSTLRMSRRPTKCIPSGLCASIPLELYTDRGRHKIWH
jgi:hypothetical protein